MRHQFVFGFFALLVAQSPAKAQNAAEFYPGKTLTLTVGYSVGGGYDTYARVLGRHMGKHLPGNPSIVLQNMPGAGSLKAANYLYNVAPKDGTAFGMFGRGIALEPLIGSSNAAQFDATKVDLFESEDVKSGSFRAVDRRGQEVSVPLVTLSVAVVLSAP